MIVKTADVIATVAELVTLHPFSGRAVAMCIILIVPLLARLERLRFDLVSRDMEGI